MKQNKYDTDEFFSAYKQMARSIHGLEAAGEWPVLKSLIPDLRNKSVLDLGCGFGWHCRYASEHHASSVIGVDISQKMLHQAQMQTSDPKIMYIHSAIEDINFTDSQFDLIFSSLAFHYIDSFQAFCNKIYQYTKRGRNFIFSVEHPMFTARSEQDWYVDEHGERLHWPVDHYQAEGIRETHFLAKGVIKISQDPL
ncbi:ubiquinone/menaquinone biosynthesis C-methylase UbiE [Paenibacillus shirakamiensis]|uniref:Ubiquinone/menaquinone biosynthesis C-methylase UbiE n=1 Tax=Paenibacillus shirakamiensis TaxID=1265935 RepID=A0ABS4JNE2_9BACL|nr:ubiquinone/menaquinone biosynthesis C-methylase UbiE [Paenibacillus shirakamiensis]